jgi:hypothetical protein
MSSLTGVGTLTDAIYRDSLDPARLALVCGSLTGPFAGVPYAWLADSTVNMYIVQGSDLALSDGTEIKTNTLIQYGPDTQAAGDALLKTAQLSGLPIDYNLMLLRWSAPIIMQIRQNNGYAWVPAYGSANINIAPGLSMPAAMTNYTPTMPAGAIKVSTDAADYPAWAAPSTNTTGTTVWTPDLSVMLSWADPPTLVAGVMTPGQTHYFFGVMAGQNPALGQTCVFQGSTFVCAPYPNGEPMGVIKMWMLTGAAS